MIQQAPDMGFGVYDNIIEDNILVWTEECGFVRTTRANMVLAEYHLERNFFLREYALLEELYDFMGFKPLRAREYDCKSYGWTIDELWERGYSWIDFYHKRNILDGKIYYELVFDPDPWYIEDLIT